MPFPADRRALRTGMVLLLAAEAALALYMTVGIWDLVGNREIFPGASRDPVLIVAAAVSGSLSAYCAALSVMSLGRRGRPTHTVARLARHSRWVHGVVVALALVVYAWAGAIFNAANVLTALLLVTLGLLWGHAVSRVLGTSDP